MKLISALFGAAASVLTFSAQAATIDWAQWSPVFTTGTTTGAATATVGSTSLSYAGEVRNLFFNFPSWNPATTFSGGSVDNQPPSSGGMIQLFGGLTSLSTITFATPVVDPVMAIWSLGQGGSPASFVFSQAFTIESGGPNAEFGGASITAVGNTVNGVEGNGVIQFHGTFTQIAWNNPQFENYYGFTVGVSAAAPGGTPIPGALPLFATGIGVFGLLGWRRKRRARRA